jgi:hypothetical protein
MSAYAAVTKALSSNIIINLGRFFIADASGGESCDRLWPWPRLKSCDQIKNFRISATMRTTGALQAAENA